MERHERYDPEDIEHLLSERSFDELLEEERAYVLRHLGGRDEYENMRALLLHVRHDEQRREDIDGDDHTRDRVLAAFRAQQRPTWRIWLNSLASAFAFDRGGANWRPALAFGSLAALAGLALYLAIALPGRDDKDLAEVRPAPVMPEASTGTTKGPAGPSETQVVDEAAQQEPAPVPPLEQPASRASAENLIEVTHAEAALEDAVVLEETEATQVTGDMDAVSKEVASTITTTSEDREEPKLDDVKVVEMRELISNQSMGNAAGAVKAKTKASAERSRTTVRARSRNMASDPEIRMLLAQGW